MRSGKFHRWRVAGMWVVTTMHLVAGNFAVPAEGPVAFRRDRLPLDAGTMATLSRQLVTLAEGLSAETAVNRRAAAQMLALATALDPGNGKAREVIADFQNSSHSPTGDAGQLEKGRSQMLQDLAWLETPEAGSQGHALAACLADVLAISDPKNPNPGTLPAAGERGAWSGWIPDLAAYEAPVVPEVVPSDEPVTEKSETDQSKILLKRAQVSTVIWKRVTKSDMVKWEQVVTPLQMVVGASPGLEAEPRPFTVAVGFPAAGGGFQQLNATLLALLKKQYPTLPAGVHVTINSPGLVAPVAPPKRQSISAAAAVLASAAISGREPDATILGVVDETGTYKLPAGFWSQLQALGDGSGGRLILPAAAADYLPSMLALERPELFFQYEILLAKDFPELVRFSEKTPDDALVKTMAKFREIRDKANLQAIGQYVANSFVRKRLVEVAQEAPFHYSAKMLAIQGAGNRPTVIPRMVLAAELQRAIAPMEWLVKPGDGELDLTELGRLGNTFETCRTQVDQLARYAEKDGRVLQGRVQDMVGGIRTLERTARVRGDYYDSRTGVFGAHATLTSAYQSVSMELAAAIGDEVPVASP